MAEKRPEIRIALDGIDEALLGTLAMRHGRSLEEEATAILQQELERLARDFAEAHAPEQERSGKRMRQ